jgi:hypothetical protein
MPLDTIRSSGSVRLWRHEQIARVGSMAEANRGLVRGLRTKPHRASVMAGRPASVANVRQGDRLIRPFSASPPSRAAQEFDPWLLLSIIDIGRRTIHVPCGMSQGMMMKTTGGR